MFDARFLTLIFIFFLVSAGAEIIETQGARVCINSGETISLRKLMYGPNKGQPTQVAIMGAKDMDLRVEGGHSTPIELLAKIKNLVEVQAPFVEFNENSGLYIMDFQYSSKVSNKPYYEEIEQGNGQRHLLIEKKALDIKAVRSLENVFVAECYIADDIYDQGGNGPQLPGGRWTGQICRRTFQQDGIAFTYRTPAGLEKNWAAMDHQAFAEAARIVRRCPKIFPCKCGE